MEAEQVETTPPATKGIPPATEGALKTLQFMTAEQADTKDGYDALAAAAMQVASYHAPTPAQAERHRRLTMALAAFLVALVQNVPDGPERSTAISRAREAKMWASGGVALEGL